MCLGTISLTASPLNLVRLGFYFILHGIFVSDDLTRIFSMASPKIVFCLKSQVDEITLALKSSSLDSKVVLFDSGGMQSFIATNKGTEINFRFVIY